MHSIASWRLGAWIERNSGAIRHRRAVRAAVMGMGGVEAATIRRGQTGARR
ncbi:hypothetical protein C7S16_0407 [Burkholderia thailandensis]|uniref:Uncharacterized protein n=2 Tax=Burkholderia thailandensis TaxID=57975 RepID=A0AAW9D171_BURTH|nr:hypothetical protein BTH_I2574 [Burkholderia thailandensis E264]MDW9240107.1 hypothetical protein [Burkholderia thailandensis]MDW9256619.1 hypothetical protein [Burkholderia thailandensis]